MLIHAKHTSTDDDGNVSVSEIVIRGIDILMMHKSSRISNIHSDKKESVTECVINMRSGEVFYISEEDFDGIVAELGRGFISRAIKWLRMLILQS